MLEQSSATSSKDIWVISFIKTEWLDVNDVVHRITA